MLASDRSLWSKAIVEQDQKLAHVEGLRQLESEALSSLIAQAFFAGMKQPEIGLLLGISRQRVNQIIKAELVKEYKEGI